MKKMISIAAFKENYPDTVLKDNLPKYGAIGPMDSFTMQDSSTDLGPDVDTDCQTDFIFDSGNTWSFINY